MRTATDKPLERYRILLVEDEPLLLLDIADALIRAGATITGHATSRQSAICMAPSKDFDCAVMDVKLRGDDVYPVAHIVRDRGKGIVFVTAHPDLPELRKHWPHAKVLAKPAAEEDVIKAIAQACNAPTYTPS